MDIPRLYKVSALPASPTAADDGVYFVRPNPSVGYVCYIITNGVAVQQDAVTTDALTTLLGALNLQQVTNNGKSTTNFTSLRGGSDITDLFFKDNSQALGVYFGSESNGNLFIGKHSNYGYTGNLGQIRYNTNELLWNGQITTGSHGTSADWNAKANPNGSNTTGGDWAIDYILSPVLQTAVGNGQVLYPRADGVIEYGNMSVVRHTFNLSSANALTVNLVGVGIGQVWHQFNFDPGAKANTSGYYSALHVGTADDSVRWNGQRYDQGAISSIDVFMVNNGIGYGYASIPTVQSALGLGNYALLSQVYTQSQTLALFVGKNGVETIYDTKTFDSSPIVPNGTLAGHTVNLGQMENYVTTQVATQVTNQITNLGFAPKAHDYREITTNNTTVNVRQFRRVVVVLTDPSVVTVELSKDAFPGTVVTIQTTSVPVDVKMGHIKAGAADSNYTLDAHRSLQVSFSEDLDAWIVEQDNSLS